MPVRSLPNDPSFDHLRKQAKRLRDDARAGEADALALIREFHPHPPPHGEPVKLVDAQLAIARSYGFATWTKLKAHLDAIAPLVWNPPPPPTSREDTFLVLACLTYAGWRPSDPAKAARLLADDADLVRASIYTAAAAGDAAAVRNRLDDHPELLDRKGGALNWPPLLYACYARMDGLVRNGSTLEVARLLLERGADANAGFLYSGSYAFTALTGAFGRGEDWPNMPPHPDCERLARLLLEAGADPNDSQALYNRHFQPDDAHLRLLLEYGLGREKGGPWLSRLNYRASPARLLIEELWAAAKNHHLDRVKLLVAHGVDVNAAGLRDGRTPYEEALLAGHEDVAAWLLAHGAKRIELDPADAFALDCIKGRGEEARARLRLDPGLLTRRGDAGLIELLHRAEEAGSRDGIRLLLDLGADINGMVPQTAYDRTVLHNAAGWRGLAMVEFLLSLGADPQRRCLPFHSTPIGWAYHNQQDDVVARLMAVANIFDAVRCDGVERAAELLRLDPSAANARDEDGNPLLAYAHTELRRQAEMMALLVAHGADVNARFADGATLLDRALSRGLVDYASLLRSHGAKTSAG